MDIGWHDRCAVVALILVATTHLPAAAEEEYDRRIEAGSKSITLENDIGASDRYYTSGIRFRSLKWNDDAITDRGSFWTYPFRVWWIFSGDAIAGESDYTGYAVGQNFYTPENIEATELQVYDRPYGAALYYGFVRRRIDGPRILTSEFDLGFIGPMALGESIQRGWHEIINIQIPNGWHHQIRSLPLVQWKALLQWRMMKLGYDPCGERTGTVAMIVDPFLSLSGGSLMASGEIGVGMLAGSRIDRNMERIGQVLERPKYRPPKIPEGCFWQIGARARYVARPWSVFIDGTPNWRYERSHHVEGTEGFYEWELSFSVGYRTRTITIVRVQRGREFSGGRIHQFWSLSYRWAWGRSE